MKYLGYILKTKLFYLTVAIHSVLCLIILFFFSRTWSKVIDASKTFDKFTSGMLAYDPFFEAEDSYMDFGDKLIISLKDEEGEGLNLHALQFLDNCKYTDYSPLNPKTLTLGSYAKLQAGEVAITNSTASEYNLGLNDCIYVDGKKCRIKYIFEDPWQITSADFSIRQKVIFLGLGTVDESKSVGYCNFNPGEVMHRQIKSISQVRKDLKIQKNSILLFELIIVVLISILPIVFIRKNEISSLRRAHLMGERNISLKALLIELAFLIPVVAIVLVCSFLLKFDWPMSFVCLMTIISVSLAYSIVAMRKIKIGS